MDRPTTPRSDVKSYTAHVLIITRSEHEKDPAELPLERDAAFSKIFEANADAARGKTDGDMVTFPVEKGLAIICYRDPLDPVRLALSTASSLLAQPELKCRMAVHSGPIHPLGWIDLTQNLKNAAKVARVREVQSSAGWLAANSRVLRTAQRICELGEEGHLLISESTAGFLQLRTDWRGTLRDMGERELEPGLSLRLFNLYSDRLGNPNPPLQLQRLPIKGAQRGKVRVVILFKAGINRDEKAALLLEKELEGLGCEVFLDRREISGVAWAQGIDHKIRNSQVVITLLSTQSIQSEMFAYEVELAYLAGQQQNGFPKLWPIRLGYPAALPEPFHSMLGPLEYRWDFENEIHHLDRLLCEDEKDIQLLVPFLAARLKLLDQEREALLDQRKEAMKMAARKPIPRAPLEPAGGAVPLDSSFYITRPTDEQFRNALARQESIILIKGARQMGKTSLLGRGLQLARQSGTPVILTDFQKLQASDFQSIERFFMALRDMIVEQIGLPEAQFKTWDDHRNPNSNFERFWRQEILEYFQGPVAWGCDEFDRLFATNFGSEVCGLFRSWHNERVLDPASPWSRLTLSIAYATEAHLFITDLNQSPFNVGTRLSLEDFTLDQVTELNRRYGEPLESASALAAFYQLVSGHPYLVRRALQEMVQQDLSLPAFEVQATDEEGIFGDHLRRILVSLSQEPELQESMRQVLEGKPCPTTSAFYRLRSAGLVAGNSPADSRPRCQLYEIYLKRHLSLSVE